MCEARVTPSCGSAVTNVLLPFRSFAHAEVTGGVLFLTCTLRDAVLLDQLSMDIVFCLPVVGASGTSGRFHRLRDEMVGRVIGEWLTTLLLSQMDRWRRPVRQGCSEDSVTAMPLKRRSFG